MSLFISFAFQRVNCGADQFSKGFFKGLNSKYQFVQTVRRQLNSEQFYFKRKLFSYIQTVALEKCSKVHEIIRKSDC